MPAALANGHSHPTGDLRGLVKQSTHVLLTSQSVFPFDLFPDMLTIDENKVNIVYRNFFGISHVHSIFVSDITDVTVDVQIFLATVTLVNSVNMRYPITVKIKALPVQEALKARDIIQGLIATQRKKIDLKDIPARSVENDVEMAGKIFQNASAR
jgi:hypothetical protein